MTPNSSHLADIHDVLGTRHAACARTGNFREDVINNAVSVKSAFICGGINVDKLKLACCNSQFVLFNQF